LKNIYSSEKKYSSVFRLFSRGPKSEITQTTKLDYLLQITVYK
jgi:hypothetical protein